LKSRIVAICYAILGAMYLGIVAVLVNLIWAGSLSRLWADGRYFGGTVGLMLTLFAIHAAMSAFSVRYAARATRLRVCILAIAIVLFLASCVRTLSSLVIWLKGSWTEFTPQLIVPANAALAFSYGFCAWTLWRLHTRNSQSLN
jgi:hypothetical protein